MKYLLTVEYLGKNYHGSQIQPQGVTIQQTIETALRTLTQKNIGTIFSGRTDAGVNAKGQTFHIILDEKVEPARFIYALNHFLPDDIKVKKMQEVQDDFHAQKSARYRHYRYTLLNAQTPSVFDTNTLHYRLPLDVCRINQMLKHLVGHHDFSAFKSTSDNPYNDCEIYKAEATRAGEYINIDIIGTRFLYNMVRTIVGTVLTLEKDGKDPDIMREILLSKDRTKAGYVAQAKGLTLIEVGYEKYEKTSKSKERQINENL